LFQSIFRFSRIKTSPPMPETGQTILNYFWAAARDVFVMSFSRGATADSSPRREPWVNGEKSNPAPDEAKEFFVDWLSVAPSGALIGLRSRPTAKPWAVFRRPGGF
jgi:hypothetical protein